MPVSPRPNASTLGQFPDGFLALEEPCPSTATRIRCALLGLACRRRLCLIVEDQLGRCRCGRATCEKEKLPMVGGARPSPFTSRTPLVFGAQFAAEVCSTFRFPRKSNNPFSWRVQNLQCPVSEVREKLPSKLFVVAQLAAPVV